MTDLAVPSAAILNYWKVLSADLASAGLIPSERQDEPAVVYEALANLIQEQIVVQPREGAQ